MTEKPRLELTPNQMLACAAMVELAADQFANHGCNDLPAEIEAMLTPEEWEDFGKRFEQVNSGGADEHASVPDDFTVLFAAAWALRHVASD